MYDLMILLHTFVELRLRASLLSITQNVRLSKILMSDLKLMMLNYKFMTLFYMVPPLGVKNLKNQTHKKIGVGQGTIITNKIVSNNNQSAK